MRRWAVRLLSIALCLRVALAVSAPVAADASPATESASHAATPSLVTAVETGDRTTAIALIKSHADVRLRDADGTTALHWVAHESDTELARLLIAAGADARAVNDYGATPLSAAAESAANTCWRAPTSTPCVGSSRRISFGAIWNHLASTTFC